MNNMCSVAMNATATATLHNWQQYGLQPKHSDSQEVSNDAVCRGSLARLENWEMPGLLLGEVGGGKGREGVVMAGGS